MKRLGAVRVPPQVLALVFQQLAEGFVPQIGGFADLRKCVELDHDDCGRTID